MAVSTALKKENRQDTKGAKVILIRSFRQNLINLFEFLALLSTPTFCVGGGSFFRLPGN
jgi:hypothetical protein